MKKQLVAAIVIVLGWGSAFAQNTERELDSVLSIYNKAGKFNGTALVARYGRVIFEKGYGYKNTAQKTKNDTNTIFQIGSVTKTFTSAMVLMLKEQGKLKLEDKLSKYFPDYPEGNRVTIEHLLTHTSGIFNYTEDTSFFGSKETFSHQSRETMLGLFKDRGLQFSPGSKFMYSNSNYMLLGYIIEDVTHKTWYQALREMILQPLHMTHTGCDFARLKSKDKATGYYAVDGDKGMEAPKVDSSVSFAAGCIYTTVGDLDKWAFAMLKNQLLTKDDWEKATTPVLENYGEGWMVGDIYGHKSIGHNGGVHGFVSNLFTVPDEATVIILLANDMGNDLAAVRRTVSAMLNDKEYELPIARTEMKMTPKQLQDYVGNYIMAPTVSMKVFIQDGGLMGQLTGQNAFNLYAARMDYFFLKVVDAQITFIRDEHKKVTKMILRQGGREIPGLRK